MFNAPGYNAARPGQLLFPAVVNGQNVSIDRRPERIYPFPRPAILRSGELRSNRQSVLGYGPEPERSDSLNPGFAIGPRVGFAWDVLGNGKLALRGGFGIFYGRALVTDVAQRAVDRLLPPSRRPYYYNSTFTQLLSAQGFLRPQSVFAGTTYKNPATYNWSFGVQRDLGKGMILDVAYVGNFAHHKLRPGGWKQHRALYRLDPHRRH